jgi:Fibrobacter succinogenes major domain (Fib_succ_major)
MKDDNCVKFKSCFNLSFWALFFFIGGMFCLTFVCAQEVRIGRQTWMVKNLEVDTFRNGEIIFQAKSIDEWKHAIENGQPSWCYYEFNAVNGMKYGKIYNWAAVADPRGLAPIGFHIPTDGEWTILINHLGGEELSGKKLKSRKGWKSFTEGGEKICPNCKDWSDSYKEKVPCNKCKDNRHIKVPIVIANGNGDNKSGFNGLPGGYWGWNKFDGIEDRAWWWSSTENDRITTWTRYTDHNYSIIHRAFSGKKNEGLYVRCIKD